MSNATVSDQLHQMWRTRPYRLPQRGHIAGVAAGIGYRYGVDPVLIRVALVVGTIFGGAGIFLYLAAWLLFSRAGDSASPAESLMGKGSSSESTTKIVVLIVALVIAVSTIGPVGVGLGGSGLISMLALLAGLWLLHQRRPEPPEFLPNGEKIYPQQGFPVSFDAPYNAGSWAGAAYRPPGYNTAQYQPVNYQAGTRNLGERGAGSTGYTPYTVLPKSYVPTPPPAQLPHTDPAPVDLNKAPAVTNSVDDGFSAQPTPPSWDPLGVAPFAWDLPEPTAKSAPEVIEKKKRSRWTSSFIGLALVAAAVAATVASATGSEWLTSARIGAVALAVVATGLVLGAFLRKGYGLLVVTGPLLAFVVFASIVGPVDFDGRSSGEQSFTPLTIAELQPNYTVQAGDLQLDLRNLALTEDRTVAISVTMGNATIRVPEGMSVTADCTAVVAATDCDVAGGPSDADVTLTIDGSARLGNLEVLRG